MPIQIAIFPIIELILIPHLFKNLYFTLIYLILFNFYMQI